ncbi:MAG: PD-(D/E)XK nuclease domain-containing protein, partial [Gammaproteobacteria bacterium]|nr:PD-(D/E)XK nuclease domain-containing protein [Gammaproteobacteria bacterium]
VFVFEFKMAEGGEGGKDAAQQAIEQMQQKGYAEKYRDRGEPIHLVGVAFSREDRNLAAVKVVPA